MLVLDDLIDARRDDLFRDRWLPQVINPVEYFESRDLSISLLRELHAEVYLGGPRYPAFLANLPRVIELINACLLDHEEKFISELYTLSAEYEELHFTDMAATTPISSVVEDHEWLEISAGINQILPHMNVFGTVPQPNTPSWPNTRPGDVRVYARKWDLDEGDFTEVVQDYCTLYLMQDILLRSDKTREIVGTFRSFAALWDLNA